MPRQRKASPKNKPYKEIKLDTTELRNSINEILVKNLGFCAEKHTDSPLSVAHYEFIHTKKGEFDLYSKRTGRQIVTHKFVSKCLKILTEVVSDKESLDILIIEYGLDTTQLAKKLCALSRDTYSKKRDLEKFSDLFELYSFISDFFFDQAAAESTAADSLRDVYTGEFFDLILQKIVEAKRENALVNFLLDKVTRLGYIAATVRMLKREAKERPVISEAQAALKKAVEADEFLMNSSFITLADVEAAYQAVKAAYQAVETSPVEAPSDM